MIEHVLDAARVARGVSAADALFRDTDELELKFEAGRLKETTRRQDAGINLRVVAHGRVGLAGTTDLSGSGAADDLLARALASAEQGESCELALPGAGPLPEAATFDDRAAGLDVATMADVGRRLVERLERPGWQVNAGVGLILETTHLVNTVGREVRFRATGVSASADVTRVSGDDVLMAYDYVASVGLPDDAELDLLVTTILTTMARAETIVPSPEGRLPVLFTPNGSECVFLPVRQALSGKTVLQGVSPLEGKVGAAVFDEALTITDDSLVPGRVGTRPADDEGVASRRLPLVERGVVRAFVYDLETAARAGTASTGHGRRSTFGKPGISYSNLLVAPGTLDEAALLAVVGDGLVVDELIGVGQGNVVSGAFSHPVALAFRVTGGEIVGRVKDAAVQGNAYELLKRIRAVGRDARWSGGTRHVPPIVLDGVNVASR